MIATLLIRTLLRLRTVLPIATDASSQEQSVAPSNVDSPWRESVFPPSTAKDCMMQTIVLATQKGGSGKSTLAIGLALAAMQDGHTVRLIETDPQGTLANWKRRRAEAGPSVEPVAAAC